LVNQEHKEQKRGLLVCYKISFKTNVPQESKMKTLITILVQIIGDVVYRLIQDMLKKESEVTTYEGKIPVAGSDVDRLLDRYDGLFEAGEGG
jgi:hypothetical protein